MHLAVVVHRQIIVLLVRPYFSRLPSPGGSESLVADNPLNYGADKDLFFKYKTDKFLE